MTNDYISWGRVQRYQHEVKKPQWQSELNLLFLEEDRPLLGFGLGRTYGDACLNDGGVLIDMSGLRRMIHFNVETGVLRCESGVSLAEIIEVFLPRGWFPPVVPGTKFVTVGGAIANDIHGKNHHTRGTFGNHVLSLDLLRSDGQIYHCSPSENQSFYAASIGGLGLTGLILNAEIQLIPFHSAFFDVDLVKMKGLDDYFRLTNEADQTFDYTVAWIDATAPSHQLGRGIFMRGNLMDDQKENLVLYPIKSRPLFSLPAEFPVSAVNPHTCHLFNMLYYHKLQAPVKKIRQSFDSFFFPLDKVGSWNLAYGRRGFFQYQLVVPKEAHTAIRQVLKLLQSKEQGSFLSVLKSFGTKPSPGLMSFPMHGPTLTLDVPNRGESTLRFFTLLDSIVRDVGGRLYPAKDARMSPEFFQISYPNFDAFTKIIDPKFSSSFWRRIRG